MTFERNLGFVHFLQLVCWFIGFYYFCHLPVVCLIYWCVSHSWIKHLGPPLQVGLGHLECSCIVCSETSLYLWLWHTYIVMSYVFELLVTSWSCWFGNSKTWGKWRLQGKWVTRDKSWGFISWLHFLSSLCFWGCCGKVTHSLPCHHVIPAMVGGFLFEL